MDAGHLCLNHLPVSTIKCMKATCYNQVLVLSALSVVHKLVHDSYVLQTNSIDYIFIKSSMKLCHKLRARTRIC